MSSEPTTPASPAMIRAQAILLNTDMWSVAPLDSSSSQVVFSKDEGRKVYDALLGLLNGAYDVDKHGGRGPGYVGNPDSPEGYKIIVPNDLLVSARETARGKSR